MLHAHGRAKEYRVVRGPWPARIKPFKNETISSWLVRASLANFSSPSKVANYIWPGWRAWTRDIDRQLTAEQLRALEQVSSLNEETIHGMLLEPVIQRINNRVDLNRLSAWRWVIQRSTRNKNTVRSTQFCSECLREDIKPYLRRQWRLSFITVCTKHQINLLDSCPHCDASVEVHKITRGKLRQCAHCRWDMSDVNKAPCDNQLLLMTTVLEEHAFGTEEYSPTAFERLSYLITLTRRISKQSSLPTRTFDLFQSDKQTFDDFNQFSSLAFDGLNTNDRRNLLKTVTPIMLKTNEQLALSLLESGIPIGLLQNCSDTIPVELQQYFPEKRQFDRRSLDQPKSTKKKIPSRRTIERRWQAFLIKHGLNG